MVSKVFLVCVQALMIQCIAGQCLNPRFSAAQMATAGPFYGSCLAGGPFDAGLYGAGAPFASDGGALPISSVSSFPASGVSIVSENAFEGLLDVAGALPFLGTVSLEGALPTAGSGAVAYGCGNGEVAMLTEDFGGSRLGLPSGPLGYGALPAGTSFDASPIAGPFAGPGPFAASGPFAGGPCAGGPFAGGPFAGGPYASGPFAGGPYAGGPFADGPFAGGPYAANAPFAANSLAAMNAYGPAAAAASNGGSLPVTSASSLPPNGVNILSDNAYEGGLSVVGAVPFLGTVALEGALPTAGAGSVAYGCGNGEVAMLTEDFGAANFAGPYNMGYRRNGFYGCNTR